MGLKMSIMTKRMLAEIIDYSIFGFLMVIFRVSELPEWVFTLKFNIGVIPATLPSFGSFLIVIPIIFKDFVFGNAGIGKKIMGLVIVDKNNQKPAFKVLLKRGIIMPFLGTVMFAINSGTQYGFTDWEMKKFKTKVVTKKELKRQYENVE